MDKYEHVGDGNSILMGVKYPNDLEYHTYEFELTHDNLGPLESDKIVQFMDNVTHLYLKFQFIHRVSE